MADLAGQMTLPEAADVLRLPVEGVQALVGAGYLRPSAELLDGPRFAMGDLKAFLARNVEDASSAPQPVASPGLDDLDPQALLDALDLRSEDMARRALDLLVAVFPGAGRWSLARQARFIEEARARFQAILAVASLGAAADDSLFDELGGVGAETALSGAPLTEVLMVLRISRDLIVQTAVEVAEERGRHWGLALSLVLTRVLPALDRLTDAIARGYWVALARQQEEEQARYANVIARASDGVYEVSSTVLGLGATLAEHGGELGAESVRSVGAKIHQQVERMSRLADDLHEISRLELGSLVLSPRAVALGPVVSQALDALEPSLDASDVSVAVGEDLRVIADPRRLEQVVVNLVENALRFGAPPVEVCAGPSSSGTGIDLRVIDHGEGVEQSLVPTSFSELGSLTRRPRRRPADGGLGLALVRGLVQAMGGRVGHEAVPGGGAAFVVTLPSA